jgi:hypothetical protein
MNTFISYEGLPISSGGAHSVSAISSIEVYNSLISFLEACTNFPSPTVELLFDASEAKGSGIKLWELTKQFGLPNWNLDSYLSTKQHLWVWKVKSSNAGIAFENLEKFDTLTLTFLWKFKFINPKTKEIIEGQDAIPAIDERLHNSQIYLRASKRSTVSVWFTLPFSSLTEAFNYFNPFQKLLPFTPSDKHWRVWSLSKSGKWIPRQREKNAS